LRGASTRKARSVRNLLLTWKPAKNSAGSKMPVATPTIKVCRKDKLGIFTRDRPFRTGLKHLKQEVRRSIAAPWERVKLHHDKRLL